MVLISFIKPNLVINSDILMKGEVKVFDRKKHLLSSLNVTNKSFVTINVKPDWPKDIDVEIDLEAGNIKKEISI
jgi:hypothetical protein